MLHSVLLNKLVWRGEDFGQSGDSNPGQLQLLLRCGDQDFLVFVCVCVFGLVGQVWPDAGPLVVTATWQRSNPFVPPAPPTPLHHH